MSYSSETLLMKHYCHLGAHVTGGRKPCEKGAFHRELIPSATTASIIHGVGIALRAGGASLLPAVTRTLGDAGGHALAEDRIYLFTTTASKKMFFHQVVCM